MDFQAASGPARIEGSIRQMHAGTMTELPQIYLALPEGSLREERLTFKCDVAPLEFARLTVEPTMGAVVAPQRTPATKSIKVARRSTEPGQRLMWTSRAPWLHA